MKDRTLYLAALILILPSNLLCTLLCLFFPETYVQFIRDILGSPVNVILFSLISLMQMGGFVFGMILLYRAWSYVQILRKEDRKFMFIPTAGWAVGSQFIPIVYLYCIFVTYGSLWKYVASYWGHRKIHFDSFFPRLSGVCLAILMIIQATSLLPVSLIVFREEDPSGALLFYHFVSTMCIFLFLIQLTYMYRFVCEASKQPPDAVKRTFGVADLFPVLGGGKKNIP